MIKVCPCGTMRTVSPFKLATQIDWRCSETCNQKYSRLKYIPPSTRQQQRTAAAPPLAKRKLKLAEIGR